MDNIEKHNILGIFRSKARSKILYILFLNPEKEFYTRELEKKLGISAGNIHRELKKIEFDNIIKSRKVGNLVFYKVNKDNSLYSEFKKLIMKTVGIDELLKPFFKKEKDITKAFIYGSYARGNFDVSSDIDIFILASKNGSLYEKINNKILEMEKILSREINIDYMLTKEYNKRLEEKDPYILDLIKNTKLFIKGGEFGI
jgi:predicted nucleotidyltransferase